MSLKLKESFHGLSQVREEATDWEILSFFERKIDFIDVRSFIFFLPLSVDSPLR